jgi:acetate kinase
MAAAAEGLDALVFTGGIGEHSAEIRGAICARLRYLGLEARNADGADGDRDVATSDSTARVLVIAAREDLTVLRQTRQVLARNVSENVSS